MKQNQSVGPETDLCILFTVSELACNMLEKQHSDMVFMVVIMFEYNQ